ncbi:MAG TPA: 1-acyl-sn-glycerol-3-phosphate acyltransferase [Draconibacterium sp.]|nr:1-acyl-sn-glycerol-3-phosphate acyltransferase [Draconibacterium sp.]
MKYEKWSLGYWCLKQYIIFADWLIHKKVIVTGKEKIPRNKPIVFAPNHQNALSDPMAVLLHTQFQPVWLARADIFKSKTINAILRFLKIMPVYRIRDGKENLVKNDKTFADSIKVLENNFALALFPEAAHSGKRQMLSHKKAVPRIVFMAEEKTNFNLDIQIIPTGIYYSHYWKFNRTLIVNFGEPVPVKNYTEQLKENPNVATIALRKEIESSIKPLVLNIASKNYYNEFEILRNIYGKHFLERQGIKNTTFMRFQSDQLLAQKLDEIETKFPEETAKIVETVISYSAKLKKLKIRDWLVSKNENNIWKIFLNKLILIIGLPVFIYGALFNIIPFLFIDSLIRKKVKDWTFWSSFFLVAGILLFPLVYIIELLAVSWLLPGAGLKLLFLVSLPFAGKLAFKWYILFRKTLGRWRILCMNWFKSGNWKNLLSEKEAITEQLDNLIAMP